MGQRACNSSIHFALNFILAFISATSLAILGKPFNLSHLTRFYNKRVIYKYIKLSISINIYVCTHILASRVLYIEIQGLNAIFPGHSGIFCCIVLVSAWYHLLAYWPWSVPEDNIHRIHKWVQFEIRSPQNWMADVSQGQWGPRVPMGKPQGALGIPCESHLRLGRANGLINHGTNIYFSPCCLNSICSWTSKQPCVCMRVCVYVCVSMHVSVCVLVKERKKSLVKC